MWKINFGIFGRSLIGIIIVIVVIALITGGLYYYFQKKIPGRGEPGERAGIPSSKEELLKGEPFSEEVIPPKPTINIGEVQSIIASLIEELNVIIEMADQADISAVSKSLQNYKENFTSFVQKSGQLDIKKQTKEEVADLRYKEWENYKLFLDFKKGVVLYPQLSAQVIDIENLIESYLEAQTLEATKTLLIPKFRGTSYLDQNFSLTLLENHFNENPFDKISIRVASAISKAGRSNSVKNKCGILYEGRKDRSHALDFIVIGADKIVPAGEGGGYECKYSDKFDKFVEDAEYTVNEFLSIEPYSDYKDVFNFYYSKEVTECVSGEIYCRNWQKIADECGINYDAVVILENGCFEKILPFGSERRGRGMASSDEHYAVVEQDAHTFVHEISHLLGLGDKYCFSMPGPGIFDSLEKCSKPECEEGFDYTIIPGGTCCYQLPYCQWRPEKSNYYTTNEKSLMQMASEAIKKGFSAIEEEYLREFLSSQKIAKVIHKKVVIDPTYAKETWTMTLIQPCWTYESWIDLEADRYRQELHVSSSRPPGFEYTVESTDEAGNPVRIKGYCDIEIDITDGATERKLALSPYLKAAEWIDPTKGKHGIGNEITKDPYTVFKTRLEKEECYFDGTDIFEEKKVYKIKCPTYDGNYRLYYIDAQTYLPIEEMVFEEILEYEWQQETKTSKVIHTGKMRLIMAYRYIIGEIINRESLPLDFFELKIPGDYKLQEFVPYG